MQKVNIKYIAKKAGVSTATVSRVLNSGNVSEETRRKVQRTIDEYNYVPSAIAQSLSVQKSRDIGFITPDIANPFSAKVLAGVMDVAGRHEYIAAVFSSDERPELEHRILDVVRRKRLDGVIISPVQAIDEMTRQMLEELNTHGIPVVQFDRKLQDADLSAILADNEKGTYEAVSLLIREGHKKVAILEGDAQNWAVKERILGYCRALVENGIPLKGEYMIPTDQRTDRAYAEVKKILESDDPPTAIFTCNNFMTLGALKYFTEKGLMVGRDISLIGFDEVDTLNIIGYPVSVLAQDGYEMGQRAMELLLRLIEGEQIERENARLPIELILRGSEKIKQLT